MNPHELHKTLQAMAFQLQETPQGRLRRGFRAAAWGREQNETPIPALGGCSCAPGFPVLSGCFQDKSCGKVLCLAVFWDSFPHIVNANGLGVTGLAIQKTTPKTADLLPQEQYSNELTLDASKC